MKRMECTKESYKTYRLYAPLGKRETQMLKLAVTGHTNKEIAATMGIKRSTLYKMWANVYFKFAVHDSRQAVAAALKLKLVHIAIIAAITSPSAARPSGTFRPLTQPVAASRLQGRPPNWGGA